MACEANQKSQAHVELKINGKEIELNSFVQNFVSQTVLGMVKSLRDVNDVETIKLTIEKSKIKND
ncbi:MAG TPA: hypothetical protein ENH34_02710 [Phycisphaerales bacterium]|nr:hypothetical protein [Phycisphaerales bacterium]